MKTFGTQYALFSIATLVVFSSATRNPSLPISPDILRLLEPVRRVKATRNISDVLSRSIPALSVGSDGSYCERKAVEVSTKTRKMPNFQPKIPSVSIGPVGLYYGIVPDDVFEKLKKDKPKRVTISDTMSETLVELRNMREELHALRVEMREMKKKLTGDDAVDDEAQSFGADSNVSMLARGKRQREFEQIGADVERWARKLLFEEEREGNGWEEVKARKAFNPDGKTTAYIKWMKDSRGKYAKEGDDREYPCIKMYSTIDAPLEEVCTYLSLQQNLPEYNELVVNHREVEEISPYSKICWGQTPQILFVKPRDFITFCHHRYLKDGTQVLVNQACDHPEYPACTEEKGDKVCRAYALRGANFISRDPNDPDKTRFAMLSHGNPGGDIPQWACKTCINALAPIEPFKLFHKINVNVKRSRPQLQQRLQQIEMVSSSGQKFRPAGIAQLGYACFWPEGARVAAPEATDNVDASQSATTMGGSTSDSSSPGTTTNVQPQSQQPTQPLVDHSQSTMMEASPTSSSELNPVMEKGQNIATKKRFRNAAAKPTKVMG